MQLEVTGDLGLLQQRLNHTAVEEEVADKGRTVLIIREEKAFLR